MKYIVVLSILLFLLLCYGCTSKEKPHYDVDVKGTWWMENV